MSTYNNDPQALPQWANDIRSGNFQSAEEQLVNAAATKMHITQEQRRIEQQTEFAEYVKLPAAQRLQEAIQRGEIRNQEEGLQFFERAMQTESRKFKDIMRGRGEMRTETEPWLPANGEVRDYIAERRAQVNHLKEEGKKLPGILSGR